MIAAFADVGIGRMALNTSRGNGPGIRRITVNIAWAVYPVIRVGKVRNVVLIELVAVPVKIGLAHLG